MCGGDHLDCRRGVDIDGRLLIASPAGLHVTVVLCRVVYGTAPFTTVVIAL
jgi:hypothetical protein